jgi:hypothetical protein
VLKEWIKSAFSDFPDDLLRKLVDFITKVLRKDHPTIFEALRDDVSKRIEARKQDRAQEQATMALPRSPFSFERQPILAFMAAADRDVAEQLTLLDFQAFRQISLNELLNQAWNKPKLKYRSLNVLDCIQRSTRLTYWVCSMVLFHPDVDSRRRVLEKFIAICRLLREMNNFNSLMAVSAGLNLSPVHRLKKAWEALHPSSRQLWDDVQQLLAPQQSFKEYRAALRTVQPPCLPYLGAYLTDLTFVEEGNPDEIPEKHNPENMLINFGKRELVCNTLLDVRLYQDTPYVLSPLEPLRSLLVDLPYVPEKEGYDLSLMLEPRQS